MRSTSWSVIWYTQWLSVISRDIFSCLVSNWVKLSKSWLGFVTIEISFTFFVIDLITTAVFFPSALSSDKGATLHHVLGAIVLVLGVYILVEIIVGSQHISTHFTILDTYPSRTGLPPTVWEE